MRGIGPPVASLIRGWTILLLAFFSLSVTINRSPSSIREIRVQPSAAALRLARLKRQWQRYVIGYGEQWRLRQQSKGG
jgi:hypothetical protein